MPEEPIFPNEPIWLFAQNAVTSVPCPRYSKNGGVTTVTLSPQTSSKEPPSSPLKNSVGQAFQPVRPPGKAVPHQDRFGGLLAPLPPGFRQARGKKGSGYFILADLLDRTMAPTIK